MHENRETPWLTAGESGSPAGEGESRTTGMHGSGESDGAIVPMKQSNKATGQALGAAERVEGRAPTKENVQQARAVPAQHGAAASQGLKGVRTVAKSSALPLPIQGKSRMRQSRSYGSVRGVRGNSHPYRDIVVCGLLATMAFTRRHLLHWIPEGRCFRDVALTYDERRS